MEVLSTLTSFYFLLAVAAFHLDSGSTLELLRKEDGCPYGCICQPGGLNKTLRVTCSDISSEDWLTTCREFTAMSEKLMAVDLKLSGNASSFVRRLNCLPELKSLDLSNTSLILEKDMFLDVRITSFLNLSSNGMAHLPGRAFLGLEQLIELDLTHNNLALLDTSCLKGLQSLRTLDLSFNNLSSITSELFSFTPHLEHLNLEQNKLSKFTLLPIPDWTGLQTLNLQGNHLSKFSFVSNDSYVALLRNISSLNLSGNPLECSCILGELFDLLPDLKVSLTNTLETRCFSPINLKGQNVASLNTTDLVCKAPGIVISYPSSQKSLLAFSSITLECQGQGYPRPSIMWITPWGDKFFHGNQLPSSSQGLNLETESKVLSYREYEERNVFAVSSIHVMSNGDLSISNFRGSMSGNFTCIAFNSAGNATKEISLQVYSAIKAVYLSSIFIGGYCASGFLIFGFFIAFVKMVAVKLRHKLFFSVPLFSKSPSVHPPEDAETNRSLDFSYNKPDSSTTDSIIDANSPLLIHRCVEDSTSQEEQESLEGSPGNARQHTIMDTIEDARGRLRYGVERKMERVRKNVQSIRESGSVYVHNIVESGSSAASRMKAGVAIGVETVKSHVQSFKEFCGTGDMGAQTISMVSVETDVDSNRQMEIVKQVTYV